MKLRTSFKPLSTKLIMNPNNHFNYYLHGDIPQATILIRFLSKNIYSSFIQLLDQRMSTLAEENNAASRSLWVLAKIIKFRTRIFHFPFLSSTIYPVSEFS